MKVERVGNLNYPDEARGKHYGHLRLTVTIRPTAGSTSCSSTGSAGYKVLTTPRSRSSAWRRPSPPFPPEIRKDTDLLVITRTWIFAQGDKLFDN